MTNDEDALATERRAQAAQWYARLKSLPVSKGTLEAFFEWRRDPANAQAFAEAEQLWGDAGRIGARPAMLRLTQEAMARGIKSKPHRRWPWIPVLMLAAGALVLALLLANWRMFEPSPETQVATAIGERRSLALDDGSQVEVNTDSQLHARLESDVRQVRLNRGEALFTVAHDPGRPFIVTAGNVEVRAIGTRFDVRLDEGETRVSLFEGGVEISMSGRPLVQLRAGQQWRSNARTLQPVRNVEADKALAWTQGRLVFDATPLGQAVDEINRYSARKLRLATPARADDVISGSFKTGDTAAFAKAASAMLGLSVEQREDGGMTLREMAHPKG